MFVVSGVHLTSYPMVNRLLIACLLFVVTSCASLQPYVSDTLDPFTGVRKRSMWVSTSASAIAWDALYRQSTGKPSSIIQPLANNWLSLDIEQEDTTLTVIRFWPEKGYDVPSDSRLRIKFFDKKDNGPILDLPLMGPYHTTGGSLMVKARVNAYAIRLLQREELDNLRIERVSTNESNFTNVDWRSNYKYARAFRKGSILLFEPPRERSSTSRKR